jgi:Protein of unknown function (DUF2853)
MNTTVTDYAALVAKYTPNINLQAVNAIVRYCGIALHRRDSSLVAVSNRAELDRVVKGFCIKKLGLDTETAKAAVAVVAEKMKSTRMKHRVPFYYLIAEYTSKLDSLTPSPNLVSHSEPQAIEAKTPDFVPAVQRTAVPVASQLDADVETIASKLVVQDVQEPIIPQLNTIKSPQPVQDNLGDTADTVSHGPLSRLASGFKNYFSYGPERGRFWWS